MTTLKDYIKLAEEAEEILPSVDLEFYHAAVKLSSAMAQALIEAEAAMLDAEKALYCMNIPENGPERRQLKQVLSKIQKLKEIT